MLSEVLLSGKVYTPHVRMNDSLKASMTFVLLEVAVVFLVPASSQAQWKTRWEYEGTKGAEHWSELDPDYAPCNLGKEQSPIDIRDAQRAKLPVIRFEYKSGPLRYLVNNGYTIRVNYHDAPGKRKPSRSGRQALPANAIPLPPPQRRVH